MIHASNFIDLTGKRFGRLTVLGLDHITENRRRGSTRSCGCLRSEIMIGNKRNAVKRQGAVLTQ